MTLRLDQHAERRLKAGALVAAFAVVPMILGLAPLYLLQHSPPLPATVELPLRTMLERWLVGELLALWLALFVAGRAIWDGITIVSPRRGWNEDQRMDRQQPVVLLAVLAAAWGLAAVVRAIDSHVATDQVGVALWLCGAEIGLIWLWLAVKMFGPERRWHERLPWVDVHAKVEASDFRKHE